jgi:hypothetical protein
MKVAQGAFIKGTDKAKGPKEFNAGPALFSKNEASNN